MKARVKVHLNERTQRPSVNAPNPSFLKPNDPIEIVDIINGDPIDGNNVWYELDNGAFVWSGGIEGVTSMNVDQVSSSNDYNSLIKISNSLKSSLGKGIKLCVLDSGINKSHPDISILDHNTFDTTNSNYGVKDIIGHGTHVSGLIGASSKSGGIRGIAPNCELISIKVRHENEKFDQSFVAKAIQKAIDLEADIINMSFKLSFTDSEEFKNSILNAQAKDILLVAAAGNNETLTFKKFNRPAFLDGIISVGAVDASVNKTGLEYNSELDFILPKKRLLSTSIGSKNNYEELEGSSMSTAIVSGCLALIKSSGKDPLTILKKEAKPISTFNDEDELRIYKP